MMEKLRSWLPLLPLLLLLGATYWLNLQVQSGASTGGKNQRHDPDYIIDNFTATTLDTQGKVRFVMSAQKMWHYPDDDSTHLDAPHIVSLSPEYPPVTIKALKGEISRKGEDVFLRDDVLMFRPAYADRSEATFRTSVLQILPNKDIVKTDQVITMTDARSNLTAVGMELDNKAHTVKFLSRVKSQYEPVKK